MPELRKNTLTWYDIQLKGKFDEDVKSSLDLPVRSMRTYYIKSVGYILDYDNTAGTTHNDNLVSISYNHLSSVRTHAIDIMYSAFTNLAINFKGFSANGSHTPTDAMLLNNMDFLFKLECYVHSSNNIVIQINKVVQSVIEIFTLYGNIKKDHIDNHINEVINVIRSCVYRPTFSRSIIHSSVQAAFPNVGGGRRIPTKTMNGIDHIQLLPASPQYVIDQSTAVDLYDDTNLVMMLVPSLIADKESIDDLSDAVSSEFMDMFL